MFDGLVAFAMDRWRHDCGARRVRIISRPGSPMSEGRFDLSTFRSERTNEASTLTITPKRSSSRDVDFSCNFQKNPYGHELPKNGHQVTKVNKMVAKKDDDMAPSSRLHRSF
ncbi:hypothetical protein TNCV_3016171 [Trichonephila clavipes]|nr:hypothetical protein TNCV_3016171 [Trichonephila clavipes]